MFTIKTFPPIQNKAKQQQNSYFLAKFEQSPQTRQPPSLPQTLKLQHTTPAHIEHEPTSPLWNHRAQELCESRGGRPNGPCGLCGRQATLNRTLKPPRGKEMEKRTPCSAQAIGYISSLVVQQKRSLAVSTVRTVHTHTHTLLSTCTPTRMAVATSKTARRDF